MSVFKIGKCTNCETETQFTLESVLFKKNESERFTYLCNKCTDTNACFMCDETENLFHCIRCFNNYICKPCFVNGTNYICRFCVNGNPLMDTYIKYHLIADKIRLKCKNLNNDLEMIKNEIATSESSYNKKKNDLIEELQKPEPSFKKIHCDTNEMESFKTKLISRKKDLEEYSGKIKQVALETGKRAKMAFEAYEKMQ
jgi:hypothetical protein